MATLARERAYLHRVRRKAMRGDSTAIVNTAEAYRRLRDLERMFHWFQVAAKHHDGDALLEIGHCYQFGDGTRPNRRAAERSYRAAIASAWITESGREEAMFFLATLLLGSGRDVPIEVRYLLLRANVEHDYPQAAALLKVLGTEEWQSVCMCRRDGPRQIQGVHCPEHNPAAANEPINTRRSAQPKVPSQTVKHARILRAKSEGR